MSILVEFQSESYESLVASLKASQEQRAQQQGPPEGRAFPYGPIRQRYTAVLVCKDRSQIKLVQIKKPFAAYDTKCTARIREK